MSKVSTADMVKTFLGLGYIVSLKKTDDFYVLYKSCEEFDKYVTIKDGQVIHDLVMERE